MSTVFRKNNPRRPVDWRWQLADIALNNDGYIRRSRSDKYIQKAIRFRRQANRCLDDNDYMRLLDIAPDLYEVWNLFDDGDDCEIRWEMEARLLTDQTYEQIGEAVNLTPESVELFEAIFFNVRDRVHNPSYITHMVFGKSIQAGLTERAYDTLWKMFGYWGGVHVLNCFLYRFNAPAKPDTPSGMFAFADDDVKLSQRMKALIAARAVPVNWETQLEILNIYMRMLEMERNAGEGSGASETLVMSIGAVLTKIPWTKYRPGVDVVDETNPLSVIDATGHTLRADELAIIGTGQQMPQELNYLFRNMYFPEIEEDAQDNEKTQ
jgi:hypothetical protein